MTQAEALVLQGVGAAFLARAGLDRLLFWRSAAYAASRRVAVRLQDDAFARSLGHDPEALFGPRPAAVDVPPRQAVSPPAGPEPGAVPLSDRDRVPVESLR